MTTLAAPVRPARQRAVHLRLIGRAWRHRWGLVWTTVGLIGSTAMVVVTPKLVGWAIDVGLGVDAESGAVDAARVFAGSMRPIRSDPTTAPYGS